MTSGGTKRTTSRSVAKKPTRTSPRTRAASKQLGTKVSARKATAKATASAAVQRRQATRAKTAKTSRPTAAKNSGKPAAVKTCQSATRPTKVSPDTVSSTSARTPRQILDQLHALKALPIRNAHDSTALMAQVARMSGVVVAICGAIGTLWFSQYVLSPSMQVAAIISSSDATGGVATLDPSATTTDQNTTDTPAVSSADQSDITIDQAAPLRDVVQLTIATPNAYKVELYAFEESWQNKKDLGPAKSVDATHWKFSCDTNQLTSGKNYKFSAGVWEYSTDPDAPDFTVQLDYLLVDNTIVEQTVTTEPVQTAVTNTTPAAVINVPATVQDTATVLVTVPDATDVRLQVTHTESGSVNQLFDVTQKDAQTWVVQWRTSMFVNGAYSVAALVRNQYGSYTSGSAKTVVDNTAAVIDTVKDTVTDPATDAVDAITEPVTEKVLPTIAIATTAGKTLTGTQRIELSVTNGPVTAVSFFVRDLLTTTKRFIGAGTKASDGRWYLNWYTSNTPNGRYQLSALANSAVGVIQSEPVAVSILNETEPTPAVTEEKQQIVEEVNEVKSLSDMLSPAGTGAASETTTDAPVASVTTGAEKTYTVPERYQTKFNAELQRLGTALRSGDDSAVIRIRNRIDALITRMIAADPALSEADRANFEVQVQATVDTYEVQVETVNTLLTERQQAGVLKDTDGDGISDFDEVAIYNTDPTVADTDNDGFVDGAEVLAGYDPLSDARESVIVYESPKDAGVFREDVLSVDSIISVTQPAAEPAVPQATTAVPVNPVEEKNYLLLTGRALPSSYVTLYMYSTPVIVTVKTAPDGSWEYRFEHELEDGQHNVYVGITDNAGRVVAKSQPLTFIKEAQAVTPLQAAVLNDVQITDTPRSSLLFSTYMIYALVSVSVLAIGLILIMLGLHLETRRRPNAVPDAAV